MSSLYWLTFMTCISSLGCFSCYWISQYNLITPLVISKSSFGWLSNIHSHSVCFVTFTVTSSASAIQDYVVWGHTGVLIYCERRRWSKRIFVLIVRFFVSCSIYNELHIQYLYTTCTIFYPIIISIIYILFIKHVL